MPRVEWQYLSQRPRSGRERRRWWRSPRAVRIRGRLWPREWRSIAARRLVPEEAAPFKYGRWDMQYGHPIGATKAKTMGYEADVSREKRDVMFLKTLKELGRLDE